MDPNCCTPTKVNQVDLKRLLMSILDSSGLNYLPYDEAKILKKTDERDRPSRNIRKETKQPKSTKNALPSSLVSRKGICGFNIIHSYDCTKRKGGFLLHRM